MIGIVIVAHGGLARELLAALEHVVGPQDGVRAVCVDPECDRILKSTEISSAADAVDQGNGVIIATDLHGGSPSNLSKEACTPPGRMNVYGVNLAVLIVLAKSRHLPLGEAVAISIMGGRKYLGSPSEEPSDLRLAGGRG